MLNSFKPEPFKYYIVDVSNPDKPFYMRFGYTFKTTAQGDIETGFVEGKHLIVMKGTELILKKVTPSDLELRPKPNEGEDEGLYSKLNLNRLKKPTAELGTSKRDRAQFWAKVKRRAIKTLKNL